MWRMIYDHLYRNGGVDCFGIAICTLFFDQNQRMRLQGIQKRIFVERSTLDSIPLLYLYGEDVVLCGFLLSKSS